MGYKCTPQLKGLVRGEPAPDAKHRANGKKICQEFGNERYSKSETLDRTRSHLNEYFGFKSGGKCWDYMCSKADDYIIKGKTKNGKEFERHLPHNAVIGYACIINPPEGMTAGWTQDDYDKFYSDSLEALNHIEPRLFRKDTICMMAEHKDEDSFTVNGEHSQHLHVGGIPKDAEGRYCGNLIDAKLFDRINEAYPAFMRGRGWELDDLDRTDFKRCGEDSEYAKERNAKRKNQGRSVNRYRADEAIQKMIDMHIDMQAEQIGMDVDYILFDAEFELERHALECEIQEAADALEYKKQAQAKDLALRCHNLARKESEIENRDNESRELNEAAKMKQIEQDARDKDLDLRLLRVIGYEDWLETMFEEYNDLDDCVKESEKAKTIKNRLDEGKNIMNAIRQDLTKKKANPVQQAMATAENAERRKKLGKSFSMER